MAQANLSHAQRSAALRARAREEITNGTVTQDYPLEAAQSVRCAISSTTSWRR